MLSFLFSFLVAILITPGVRTLAKRLDIYAYPNHRTVHEGAVPKWGGGSIMLSFVISAAVLYLASPKLFVGEMGLAISLVAGCLVLFLLGSFDDKFDLNCNLKLSVELAVALAVALAGWRFEVLILPGFAEIKLGFFSYPFTMLWIVGVINAVNMVDGLDGLASGIALVVVAVSSGIAALFNNPVVILFAPLLAGALLGFLRYNINPASIFMGDSGSLPLGFLLALLSLRAATISPGRVAVLVPLLLLCLPLTDTTLAIIRRVRRGIHPFHADREHIHHRLVRLGLSQPGAALSMVGLSLIFGILAFLLAQGMHTDFRFLGQLLP
ncbi:MAG TPA: MraY family glycosyltransferase [bacterium]|nr:MraY family glycosyltransferase [bacterium]HQG45308.1 MraY family glycosyltransferase [bacterium]HQI50132.1 MraY family glycosyltransferase [bacterium]HQJ64208.1 MraY family glycosyltransferase [bacterium]